jgi:hypothetical protein
VALTNEAKPVKNNRDNPQGRPLMDLLFPYLPFQEVSAMQQKPLALAIFVTVMVGVCQCALAQVSTQDANQTVRHAKAPVEPVYSVVSPLGHPVVKTITMVPRPDTLDGKTVCMVWNHSFQADITLPAIGESLKEKYPDIKIIPHTEIDAAIQAAGRENPSAEEAAILQAVLKEKGCVALISGNGG